MFNNECSSLSFGLLFFSLSLFSVVPFIGTGLELIFCTLFFPHSYVVAILEAISDVHDTEKMKRACTFISEMRRKRYSKNNLSEDSALPIEWLHPKEGHHINSIDSLLYHEDLVREYYKDTPSGCVPGARREIIEKALFQKSICKWNGIVSEIWSDWKGTICFKKHIAIPFVPVNVQHGMPCQGDIVQFCIAFHWRGPRAYYVVSEPGAEKSRKAVSRPRPENDEDDDEDADADEEGLYPLVHPLHRRDIKSRKVFDQEEYGKGWDRHLHKSMQGLVLQTHPDKGYGFIGHPNVEEDLFFNASQMDPPVDSLNAIESLQTVVSFHVDKSERGPRATNVEIVVRFMFV